MDNHEEPLYDDEPVILSLEAYRRAMASPDDQPPQPTNDRDDPRAHEAYWSGRNHAMRRSARWAA
jgi:hypothetical protein